MGNDFDPNNFPKTKEEVLERQHKMATSSAFNPESVPKTREEAVERQREMDAEMVTNSLKWINKMRETPPKNLTTDDIFTIEQLSYYINEMYEYEDVREDKRYPYIDENMRTYLREQAGHHRRFLIRKEARKKRAKVAKTSTSVVCILIVAMFVAQGISTFAFGYDLFGNIADWGKGVLGIAKDVVVYQDNVTLVRNGKTDIYENIENAIKSLDIKVLYPSYLPDGTHIKSISYIDQENYFYIAYGFNNDNLYMKISSNPNDYNSMSENEKIGDYECVIYDSEGCYEVSFKDDGYTYTISYPDFNILSEIIKNLKYN